MTTFSCAVQAVQVGDAVLRFGVEHPDTSRCTLTVNDQFLLTFHRNGALLSVEEITKDEPAAEEETSDEREKPVRRRTSR